MCLIGRVGKKNWLEGLENNSEDDREMKINGGGAPAAKAHVVILTCECL